MSTIAEIAELLGLSKSTVSRALRGQPGIASSTVDAVRDLAAELGYVPSATAVGLATGRHRTVGVIVPSVERWFYTAALSGIDRALAELGYDVVLFDLSKSTGGRRKLAPARLPSRVDALIVLSTDFLPEEWQELIATGLPIITLGAPTPGIRRVGIDDYQVGRVVTEHVVALGHVRIGHLGGVDPQALIETSVNDRERAFRDVLREYGIPVREEWMISGGYRTGLAKRATESLLRLEALPTALVCASDEMALGAMYACEAHGLRVGRDIAVIGIDGHEYAEAFDLATVQQYPAEQGALAAETLIAELEGKPPVSSFLPSRWSYIARGSIGVAR